MDNPCVRLKVTDMLSGVSHFSADVYKKSHAARIARKSTTHRYKYEVVQ